MAAVKRQQERAAATGRAVWPRPELRHHRPFTFRTEPPLALASAFFPVAKDYLWPGRIELEVAHRLLLTIDGLSLHMVRRHRQSSGHGQTFGFSLAWLQNIIPTESVSHFGIG